MRVFVMQLDLNMTKGVLLGEADVVAIATASVTAADALLAALRKER